jgi:CRP-like cAMP-binding protein
VNNPNLLNNKLLAALPSRDLGALREKATIVSLPQRTIICEADSEIDEILFPLQGMISLVFVMKTGKAVETATVGREGVYGAMAGIGLRISHVRANVQIPLVAARIQAPDFRKLVAEHQAIWDLCVSYNEVLLDQARITAACNALHQVEARFCRWLLQTSDRAQDDVITLTQEFLSEMLGVRRTSVTEVAIKMQQAGIIRYARGRIVILDREGLKAAACECYETMQQRAPA